MRGRETVAVRIDAATSSDAEALARLSVRVHGLHVRHAPGIFTEPTDEERQAEFRRQLSRDDARAFLAYVDDEAVGYVLAQLQERPATPHTRARRWLYIDQISVDAAMEGRSIGRQLVQRVVDWGRSLGIDEFVTDVWSFNEHAQTFFTSCGFQRQIQRFSMRLGE
jgi:GNAT superfamily N-acetyltransferase